MIFEKIFSAILSIPIFTNLDFNENFLTGASSLLSCVSFVGQIVNIDAILISVGILISATLVCGIVKLLLSFIP